MYFVARFTIASLTIEVLSVNEFDPIIRSSIGQFVGYVEENSPIGTIIKDQLGSRAIKVIPTDPDQVS